MSGEKEGQPAYNTREGILAAIVSYEKLYRLAQERQQAAQERQEELTPFCIQGELMLGRDGHTYRMLHIPGQDGQGQLQAVYTSAVMAKENGLLPFSEAVRSQLGLVADSVEAIPILEPYGPQVAYQRLYLPPPQVVCRHCSHPFRISEAPSARAEEAEPQMTDLSRFAGKTLDEVQAIADQESVAASVLQRTVMNEAWKSKAPGLSPHERDGWRHELSTNPKIDGDYVIREGDQGIVEATYYFHGDCWDKKRAEDRKRHDKEMRDGLTELFEGHDFKDVSVVREPLPPHVKATLIPQAGPHGAACGSCASCGTGASSDTDIHYFRVITSLGQWGVAVVMEYGLLLDLEGTGLTIGDIHPNHPGNPEGMEWMAMLDLESDEPMLRLWKALAMRRLGQKQGKPKKARRKPVSQGHDCSSCGFHPGKTKKKPEHM